MAGRSSDFVRDNTPLRFTWVPQYSDYHPEAPGGRAAGRSCEPIPMDARFLGDELDRLHPQYTKAPANLIVTQADYRKISLGLRTLARARSPWSGSCSSGSSACSAARRCSRWATRSRSGSARAWSTPTCRSATTPSSPTCSSRTAGSAASRSPTTASRPTIRARRGVILGSGGFEKNLEMREKYQPHPTSVDWTTGSEFNTGGGILAGIAAGAETDLLDDAWWGPTIPLPNGPWFCLAERNLPGSIIVNQAGQRFMNEALPYVEAVHEIYKGEATGVGPRARLDGHRPALPQPLPVRRPVTRGSPSPGAGTSTARSRRPPPSRRWPPRSTYRRRRCARRSTGSTASRRRGVDEDFHRGESAYDKYYSDPRVKPNPSLHTIDQAPFYAVKIVPGDLGTKGGLVTDERARVLRPDGSVIAGLYAAGNVSSAVMGHTYAGPGATIGPALAFGYLAAEDIAASVGEVRRPRSRSRRPPDADRPERRDRCPGRRGVLLLVVERRPALPPGHRRGLPPG